MTFIAVHVYEILPRSDSGLLERVQNVLNVRCDVRGNAVRDVWIVSGRLSSRCVPRHFGGCGLISLNTCMISWMVALVDWALIRL